MFNRLLAKLAEYLGETSEYGVSLNQSQVSNKSQEFLQWASLSDLLPYQTYDDQYGLFIGKNTIGFVFEVSLFIGSDDKLENELAGLFKSILPGGSSIQFLLSALPKVDHLIDYWASTQKNKSSILASIEAKRSEYFKSLSAKGKNSKSKFRIRDFRGIVSVSISVVEKTPIVKEKIADLKAQITGVFETRSGNTHSFGADDLINYLSDLLNFNGSTSRSNKKWNKLESLSEQIIDKNRQYKLEDDSLKLDGGDYEMRFLSVSRYPAAWSFSLMSNFLGDNFNDSLKLPCSFFIHLGIYIESSKFKRTGMLAKASRVESQAASQLGKWIPALKREAEEWSFVREQLEKNERLVRSHFQVMVLDKKEDITTSEQQMLSLYRANGWEINRDKFIIMSSLISMLPLTWAEGICDDMTYLKKTKTTLSYEPINVMPLQGESKGTSRPGMLLAGRRGQLFYWYPFDEELGNTNYNVSVVGRSGSGKSVFMQELASSILRQNGKVYVLDIGRSFEKQVKLFGGQFLEFGINSQLCLNPFTGINADSKENVHDSLSVLKPIISMMAAPKGGTSDYEDSLIEKALIEVWQEKAISAGIGDIAEWFLQQQNNESCQRIGTMLFPYSKKGVYGRYFNGKANIDFASKFFVTELEGLKSTPDLQSVVVQIFMLLIVNQVMLGKKEFESGIIFDEASGLLKGNKGGEFVEQLARMIRKHRGSLIIGTQNLDDFYASPGAEAVFMNSDWLCCLNQKSESIALLKKSEKFRINDYQQKMLESVVTKTGEYSEVMIMTSGSGSIGRLILDPFSRVLYTTKAEEFREVIQEQEKGSTLQEAIENVAKRRYGDV